MRKLIVGVQPIAALAVSAVQAQVAERRIEAPACPRCVVVLHPVATLVSSEIVSLPSAVGRDGNGRYILGFADGRTPLLVFDSAGRFSGPLGRRGAGPGEFGDVAQIRRRANGGLLVLDRSNGRVALQGRGGTWATVPIPTSTFDIIELADGRFIVNASTRTPNGIAKPLFLLNAKGDVIRGFGEEAGRPVLPSTRARSHFRRLLSIGPESFWAVEGAFRFRLVEWTSDGVRGVVLTGRVGWMPGKEVPYSPVTPDTPPQSVIAAVGAVNDSLAIVMAAVADPEWSRGLDIVPQPPSPGELHRVPASLQYRVARPAEAFDTQLEVLDVRRKTLVASSRVDAAIGYALNDGLVAGIEVGPSGEYSVRIYRVLVRAS